MKEKTAFRTPCFLHGNSSLQRSVVILGELYSPQQLAPLQIWDCKWQEGGRKQGKRKRALRGRLVGGLRKDTEPCRAMTCLV